ncbi:MAG: chaperone modulator CbpM [Bacteroidota bacterium]|nr:chaperone modulator CbpM [Bacteroidota bacterium]
MEQEELIPAQDFCIHHNIEYSFISSLHDSGLIQVMSVESSAFIPADEMHKLEKFVRLHYDLDINIEGIETINYLLEKMEEMQREITSLKNKMYKTTQ